ncbi:MAG: tRNA (guanosine(46)-N7)-methyltransferase TrmB [Gammaproteobacteria bacterium]|nr:tRNA (guanosine(46)-N7)-methyltransferase TrmB [Gammaproteobacteria bacterium]MDD9959177.1 tRNA (guanosine(46)-N7)-methyltransferase TrmB [Gammaproteobacteria bacterium]
MATESTQHKRPVRSYVVRSGRLTDSQRKAIDAHWDRHVIDFNNQPLDLETLFTLPAPLILEIGFGMGASLLSMAQQDPHTNFLGIEVHKPGLGKVLHEIEANDLRNLKLICHDAKDVFEHGLGASCLDRINIFFPDPWPKKRHHKRRLVQSDFVELLSSKLKTGAVLHLATDWEPYATHMLEVLEASPNLANKLGEWNYWENPERPPTKFEARGKRLGHGVWDLLFVKTDS